MKEIKNNNGFLITCVSCIVLVLALCYFGVNNFVNDTYAANCYVTYSCSKGTLSGNQCVWTENVQDTEYKTTNGGTGSCGAGWTTGSCSFAGYNNGVEIYSCSCSRTVNKTVTKTGAATATEHCSDDNDTSTTKPAGAYGTESECLGNLGSSGGCYCYKSGGWWYPETNCESKPADAYGAEGECLGDGCSNCKKSGNWWYCLDNEPNDEPSNPVTSNPSGGGTTNPSGGGSSTPTGGNNKPSSGTSTPTGGNNNVENNPQTGAIAIFVCWIIGFAAIGYSVWYFKRIREN